jgi:type IV pilus assembly protein PilO
MALLPTDQRGQVMALLVLVAGAAGYFGYTMLISKDRAKAAAMVTEADSLQRIVDAAKADLQQGTVEDLRRKVAQYSANLELARRLVPERNEVPTLIDQISTAAKVRGVNIGTITPLSPEAGQPFDTHRYRLEIFGHYDQVGEFLSDIASLERIVVPIDLQLRAAPQAAQRFLGDTLGGMLVANFTIRTYVKTPGGGSDAQD